MKLKRMTALFLALLLAALPALVQADTLTSRVSLAVQAVFAKSGTLSTPKDVLTKSITKEFTSGTGNNQCNLVFRDQRTLGDGANESLDLYGVLTDPFGVVINFAKVKVIIIENLSTTQTLTVGAAATPLVNWVGDGASDTIKIPPGGFFALSAPLAGFAVTNTTADLLKVVNSAGASCIYNIVILGTSS